MNKPDKGQAEIKDLEWNAAFFHCLAEQACDAILGIRLDGRICYANLHATAMYGYTRDELCGMSIRELRAPETLTDFEEFFRRAAGGGIMFRTTHRRQDGLTFPVEVNSRGVDLRDVVLGYKCGHKNVESVKLKARKDVSNIEQAVSRRIQSDGR